MLQPMYGDPAPHTHLVRGGFPDAVACKGRTRLTSDEVGVQRAGRLRLFVGSTISDPPLTRWVCGSRILS